MGRPALSIISARSTDCRKRFANTRTTGFRGTHGYTGKSMILLDEDNPEHLSQFTSHSEKVGHFEYPFALENFDIYYIQGLKVPLDDLWAHEKAWD